MWARSRTGLKLQDSGNYDCFFFIADWHALTTDYADTSRVKENSLESRSTGSPPGLDPDKSVLFHPVARAAHAELFLLFSMITPLGWLERVPTYKEQRDNIQDKDLGTYGFLGYPLLQAADILMYGVPGVADPAKDHPLYVPVGERPGRAHRADPRGRAPLQTTSIRSENARMFSPSRRTC